MKDERNEKVMRVALSNRAKTMAVMMDGKCKSARFHLTSDDHLESLLNSMDEYGQQL